jgi:hypothetical protein
MLSNADAVLMLIGVRNSASRIQGDFQVSQCRGNTEYTKCKGGTQGIRTRSSHSLLGGAENASQAWSVKLLNSNKACFRESQDRIHLFARGTAPDHV